AERAHLRRRHHRPPRAEGGDPARRQASRGGLRRRRGVGRGRLVQIGTQIALVSRAFVLAPIFAVLFTRLAPRMKGQGQRRRRLGAEERLSLLKADEREQSDLARLLTESGLGWSMPVFVTRMVVATGLGIVVGSALGGPALALLLGAAGVALFPVLARQARRK